MTHGRPQRSQSSRIPLKLSTDSFRLTQRQRSSSPLGSYSFCSRRNYKLCFYICFLYAAALHVTLCAAGSSGFISQLRPRRPPTMLEGRPAYVLDYDSVINAMYYFHFLSIHHEMMANHLYSHCIVCVYKLTW